MFTTIISFLFVLGILVFVHELGHFLAAKRVGVYVETFSIGMGPKLLKKKIGDTEYCISGIPLGGYVKMKGENPDEETTGAADELQSKSIAARFGIFFAGPLMNILFAVLLTSFLFYIGIEEPKYLYEPPVIGWVDEGSPAEKSGLLPNDLILSIGAKAVSTWQEASELIAVRGDNSVDIKIKRGEETKVINITPELIKLLGAGVIGIQPVMKPTVGALSPNFPAEKAGMKVGDEIVEINGMKIIHWDQMKTFIQKYGSQELAVVVLRNGERLSLNVMPKKQDNAFLLGINSERMTVLKKYGFKDSIVKGVEECWMLFVKTIGFIKGIFVKEVSVKTLGGPIMIGQMSGIMVRLGFREFINFIGAVSLSLGIFNLLPIPVLDGGHIFLLFVEFLSRKPLSMQRRELAQKIGLLILIPLIIFIFYNDITRLLGW